MWPLSQAQGFWINHWLDNTLLALDWKQNGLKGDYLETFWMTPQTCVQCVCRNEYYTTVILARQKEWKYLKESQWNNVTEQLGYPSNKTSCPTHVTTRKKILREKQRTSKIISKHCYFRHYQSLSKIRKVSGKLLRNAMNFRLTRWWETYTRGC